MIWEKVKSAGLKKQKEYIRQITGSILVNPGIGAVQVSQDFFLQMVLSSRPAYLLDVSCDSFLLSTLTGTVLPVNRLGYTVQITDLTQQLDDSQSFAPGSTFSISNLKTILFVYRDNMLRERYPLDMIVNPPRRVRVTVTALFDPLANATDSFQAAVTLRWISLDN